MIETSVSRYLGQLESTDWQEPSVANTAKGRGIQSRPLRVPILLSLVLTASSYVKLAHLEAPGRPAGPARTMSTDT